jgi:hypothetical protein
LKFNPRTNLRGNWTKEGIGSQMKRDEWGDETQVRRESASERILFKIEMMKKRELLNMWWERLRERVRV